MVEELCSETLLDTVNAAVIELKSGTSQLMEFFTRLETLPTNSLTTGRADDIVLRLLKSLEDLPSATRLTEILAYLPRSANNFQGQETVVMTLTKLRKYRAACDYLGRAGNASAFSVISK